MRVLLDTSAFLKIVGGDRLPRTVLRVLDRPDRELFVSIVTGWEIAMKPELGLTMQDVHSRIDMLSAHVIPIRFEHLEEYTRLPGYQHHRDPFDRMLIAQALAEGAAIISSDARFSSYRKLRVIWG